MPRSPSAPQQASYIISGQRGDVEGEASELIGVQFGVGGGGGFAVVGTNGASTAGLKVAA